MSAGNQRPFEGRIDVLEERDDAIILIVVMIFYPACLTRTEVSHGGKLSIFE